MHVQYNTVVVCVKTCTLCPNQILYLNSFISFQYLCRFLVLVLTAGKSHVIKQKKV